MRALLLGLVGVGLAVGAVEARVCRLDGALLVATSWREPADTSLEGASFKVLRKASQFVTTTDKGYPAPRGAILIEIKGPTGVLEVRQDYEPTSSPWVTATSGSSLPMKTSWGKRSRKYEAETFGREASFQIYEGPLDGYLLSAKNCP